MQNDNENKDAVLASTNTEPVTEDVSTIKATDLKSNISSSNKRDLSAIIPQNAMQGEQVDGTLQSKENTLKSDGAIVIGNISNDQVNMTNNAQIPERIDIEQRKKDQLDALRQKKANPKGITKEQGDKAKKAQTRNSLLALLLIAIIGAGYYIYTHTKTDLDFTVNNITLELGDKFPVHSKDFVTPGVPGAVDDMLYSINTSNVIVDEVGEYEFFVTYKGVTKKGIIEIVDKTPPDVVTKDITIIEGQSYTAGSFVEKCHDLSGYEYDFENEEYANYTAPGEYNDIVIVAKDPYDNKTTKKVKLTIESKGIKVTYTKDNIIDYINNYSLDTKYELYFSDYASDNILYYANLNEDYKFFDEESYNSFKERFDGDEEYKFDNENLEVIRESKVGSIGKGLTGKEEIIEYLLQEGYQLVS